MIEVTYKKYVDDYFEGLQKAKETGDNEYIKSQCRKICKNFSLLLVPALLVKKVFPVHSMHEEEVEVFRFWIRKLQGEYESLLD